MLMLPRDDGPTTATPKKGKGILDQLDPQLIEQAFSTTGVNFSEAAKILKVHRVTLYRYVDRTPRVQEFIDHEIESELDFSENIITKYRRAGHLTANMFFLKCKGKHRGWVERLEQTGPDGGPVNIKLSAQDANL